jgi:cytochrome c-type biogenesis protein CcmE
MTRKQRRLTLIGLALAILGIAAALALSALRDNIVFFHSPTEIAAKKIEPGTRFRLGGLVKQGSVKREGLQARFEVTDGNLSLAVLYVGVLPDLFREGQGVVTEGALDASGTFRADTVLAKHDENYMPREVVDALKQQGVWQHEGKSK